MSPVTPSALIGGMGVMMLIELFLHFLLGQESV